MFFFSQIIRLFFYHTCKQHGHQQELHLRPRDKCITSVFLLSMILISKGLVDPQQFLVQQQVSENITVKEL